MTRQKTPRKQARLNIRCRRELARFFQLSLELDGPLAMPCPFAERQAPLPDAVWHQMLESDPQGYRAWCMETVGAEIEHVERECENSELFWIRHYEDRYGPLDTVWFTTADGQLDKNARTKYVNQYHTRRKAARAPIRASWKCTPARRPAVKASWKCTPLRAPRSDPRPAPQGGFRAGAA